MMDAGCGNGGSFPNLLEQVGPTGKVVRIEINTEMTSRTRAHIRENGWHNVSVIESPAQTTPLEGQFDALLLIAAHEVLTSPVAPDNFSAHLKAQGCVVAFGAKLTASSVGWLTNPFFRMISKKWLPLSPPIDTQPWRLLEGRVLQLQVEPRLGGVMYLILGKKADLRN